MDTEPGNFSSRFLEEKWWLAWQTGGSHHPAVCPVMSRSKGKWFTLPSLYSLRPEGSQTKTETQERKVCMGHLSSQLSMITDSPEGPQMTLLGDLHSPLEKDPSALQDLLLTFPCYALCSQR
jgi:hypothetical protein